jgi:pimeloyl-ACP methyl ester carboxylesterase
MFGGFFLFAPGWIVIMIPLASRDERMFSDQYAEVNGVRLHYVSCGEGPLILFLHGFPEFWYAWKNQLAEFGKDHHAVALDMRGFNLSDKPTDVSQYGLDILVEDVRAFADHLSRNKRFVLVGHDWGGFVAWAFASAHPNALAKLVIINAPHPAVFARLLMTDPVQQSASGYVEIFRSPQAEQILSANSFDVLANRVMVFGSKNGLRPEEKPEYLKAWSQPGALTGGLNYYRANRLSAALANGAANPSSFTIHVPTLVIWGEKDPAMIPQNLDGLPEFVPQLTIHRLPESSHWLVHHQSPEVNELIRNFIQST